MNPYIRKTYKIPATSAWITIANRSRFIPVRDDEVTCSAEFFVEDRDANANRDTKNKIAANTTTMSRFGPSGSLINANVALEHNNAVIPRISNETVFDLKYMA